MALTLTVPILTPPLCSQSLKVLQVCLCSLWGVFVSSHQWQLSLHVAILKKQIYRFKDFFPPLFKHVKGVVGLLPAVGISRRLTEDKLRLTAERRMVWNAKSISFHLLISHIWSWEKARADTNTHLSLLFLPGWLCVVLPGCESDSIWELSVPNHGVWGQCGIHGAVSVIWLNSLCLMCLYAVIFIVFSFFWFLILCSNIVIIVLSHYKWFRRVKANQQSARSRLCLLWSPVDDC